MFPNKISSSSQFYYNRTQEDCDKLRNKKETYSGRRKMQAYKYSIKRKFIASIYSTEVEILFDNVLSFCIKSMVAYCSILKEKINFICRRKMCCLI